MFRTSKPLDRFNWNFKFTPLEWWFLRWNIKLISLVNRTVHLYHFNGHVEMKLNQIISMVNDQILEIDLQFTRLRCVCYQHVTTTWPIRWLMKSGGTRSLVSYVSWKFISSFWFIFFFSIIIPTGWIINII